MKITKLWIKEYKNLKDFEINFQNPVSVLIGKNGSGKSNILEAIIHIFKGLYEITKYNEPNIEFVVDYIINGKDVKISYFKEHGIRKIKYWYNVGIDGKDIDALYLNREYKDCLPKNIVTYNSGNLINRQFGKINSKIFSNTLFVLSNDYYKIAILSFFYSNISNHKELLNQLNIKNILKFNISYDKSKFKNNSNSNKFEGLTDFTIYGNEVRSGIYEFLGDKLKDELFHRYIGYEKDFFNLLYIAKEDGIITEIEIIINIFGSDNEISVTDISEGQKQLLVTKGVSEFLSDGENLFLFDEPDTFLHPNWQKDFIPGLVPINVIESGKWDDTKIWNNEGIWRDNPSHFIITTHSPLLVGSSENIDIVGLENKGGKTKIICHTNPDLFENNKNIEKIDVYGNRAEFIYEKVFGLVSTRAKDFEKEINELHHILKKQAEGILLNNDEEKHVLKLKEFLVSKIGDDIDDLYLSYLSIDELSKIIKENNEKNK